ncbi:MAG: DegT/DnrJ/EryC1/StrS family aminotransferase [bacterium]
MKVPLLDLGAQYRAIKPEIDAALLGACEKTQFILGPAVADFEARFAEYCGVAACAAVNSGTNALFLPLHFLGIGPGDEVICPSWTFVATAEAIMYTGATPVLVDCDPVTFNITADAVEAAITERTKAIMPVHLYGRPCDIEGICRVAAARGIPVIEDAAQAHGAAVGGKRVGSFGRFGAFSFYPSKNLGAFGEGGAVVSDDADAIARIKRLRAHGEIERYIHGELGFNMRLEGFQGAVLGVKLAYLERWNEERRRVGGAYRKALSGTPVTMMADDAPGMRQVYHLMVVRAPKRNELRAFLESKGIGTAIHYLLPVHKQPLWLEKYGDNLSLPVSETLADEILSLPMYPEMADEQIEYVCAAVKEFYSG